MKIGAVLPLSIRGSYGHEDLGRIDILFRSLRAFCDPNTFGTFLIVTPPNETKTVSEKCQAWPEFGIRVLSEEELIPELTQHRHMRGWRKQQLVKIAAAQILTEDFFLTFDADVICLRPWSYSDLIIDNKALIQYEKRSLHPKWWKSSARILDMSPQVGDSIEGMSVTPAILSRELCHLLMRELSSPTSTWAEVLCKLHNPKSLTNWTIDRLLKSKWTEYSLYYLCAMKHGLLDSYHIRAGTEKTPQLLLIHDSHPFDQWDVAKSFAIGQPGIFCVVGSKSGLEPELVWNRVKPFIESNS